MSEISPTHAQTADNLNDLSTDTFCPLADCQPKKFAQNSLSEGLITLPPVSNTSFLGDLKESLRT
ncbi:hypothetical protein [Gilliamella apicola]|uniref:hypothetical protein n=1 Tax=Gilliamella apicola TaxID=1196095 RepID=UPI001FD5AEB4|nr:hypothetical protein [Gilliamella apicola]